jgi:cyclic pyranopterin phosphate synthase
MFDQYNRPITYLRISITDRCNLRCVYCMPEEGISLFGHADVLSFEEITEFTRCAVEMGITKVRITGGEPLVRKGAVRLVSMLSAIPGILDLSMTTNALLLHRFAGDLKEAGLQRVNISLDTIDPERYRAITRGGDIQLVLQGIKTAQAIGLSPIKINCVIKKSLDEPDAQAVRRYCEEHGLIARFIYEMDIEKGSYGVVHGGTGGDCAQCNRLRLTSNGDLKPCLFNDLAFNIRTMDSREALRRAIEEKPECGSRSSTHGFYNVGG